MNELEVRAAIRDAGEGREVGGGRVCKALEESLDESGGAEGESKDANACYLLIQLY